jgi:hypothetical protein
VVNIGKGAWHGDPKLKDEVVARMLDHRAKDEIIQGVYQEKGDGDNYRGCLLGCTLPYLKGGDRIVEWAEEVENHYGIPEQVALILEDMFEDQDSFEAAGDFAVASLLTIPVGADLSELARFRQDWLEATPGAHAVWWDWTTEELLDRLRDAPLVEVAA